MGKTIQDLPEMILFQIFSFLDSRHIFTRIPLVCKDWSEKIKEESFFKSIRSISLDEEKGGTALIEKIVTKSPNLRYLKINLSNDKDYASADPLTIVNPSLPHLQTFALTNIFPEVEKVYLDIVKSALHLKRLEVSGEVTDNMLEAIQLLKELVSLNIVDWGGVHCNEELVVKVFESCPKLEEVEISVTNFISVNALERLIQLHSGKLKSLGLFCDLTDEAVHKLIKCSFLSKLKIGCEEITDQSLLSIKSMSQLHTLSLYSGESFTYNGFNQLFNGNSFPELRNLKFTDCCSLADSVVKAIAVNCKKLETINFENCFTVGDEGIYHLMKNSPQLRVLRIHGINSDFQFLKNLHQYLPALKCLSILGEPFTLRLLEKFTKSHPNFNKCVLLPDADAKELYNRHLECSLISPVVLFYQHWFDEKLSETCRKLGEMGETGGNHYKLPKDL